jgi:Flp pilus assembly pilin Flp
MRDLTKSLRAFHEDEEGMEALQIVMIVAMAAVCLIAIVKFWPTVKTWFSKETSEVTKMKD